jgi:hypothetical protein
VIATCDGSGKIPYRGHEEDVCAVSPTVLPPFEVARLQHPAYVASVGYGSIPRLGSDNERDFLIPDAFLCFASKPSVSSSGGRTRTKCVGPAPDGA